MTALRAVLAAWRRFYGRHPLHLLLILGSFAGWAYVVSFVVDDAGAWLLLAWFVGAVLANDLVLYPAYAAADRALLLGRRVRRALARGAAPRVSAANHLRVPAILAGMLGLAALPTITRHAEEAFRFTSARTQAGYLEHWLAITAALFVVSAVVYAGRLAVAAVGAHRHAGNDRRISGDLTGADEG